MFSGLLIPGMAELFRLLGMNSMKPKQTLFFVDVVKQTIRKRKTSKVRKNDLIDLMLDAMEGEKEEELDQGEDQYDRDMKLTHKANGRSLDEISFIGTAMVFLVAGYDTTGMTLSWICYELAKNEDLQGRLQEQVDEVYEAADGRTPDYHAIQGFNFLDQLIQEALRLHTMISIQRVVTSPEYTIP